MAKFKLTTDGSSRTAWCKFFVARSSSAQTRKVQKVPPVQQVSTTEAQIEITKNSLEKSIRKRMWRGSNIYDKTRIF